MIRYTSAPEDYDGFGTKTIEVVGVTRSRFQPVRKIDPDYLQWQCMRYASGLWDARSDEQG